MGRDAQQRTRTDGSTAETRRLWRNVPVFAALRKAAFDCLSTHAELLDLPRGRVLFRAGDAPSGSYCVLSGAVRLTMPGRSSEQGTGVGLMRAGDVFDVQQ
jgi:CRP-like cAMP-binding protein